MKVIDLNRIRQALPKEAEVTLGKTKGGSPYIECLVNSTALYKEGTLEEEAVIAEVKNWQREIIGKENIAEFYTEETGRHWFVYLKRVPIEFINVSENDINSFVNIELLVNGKIGLK